LPAPLQPPRNQPLQLHLGSLSRARTIIVLAIRAWARLRCATKPSPQEGVILAAPTGIAAFNVGGSTIHSAFRLKVEKNGRSDFENLRGVMLASTREMFKNIQFVVIDEVSMVSSLILNRVHRRLNQVLSTPDGIFGNIGVILLGDFLQLQPVLARALYEPGCPFVNLGVGFHLYRRVFHPVFLQANQRQKGDTRLLPGRWLLHGKKEKKKKKSSFSFTSKYFLLFLSHK